MATVSVVLKVLVTLWWELGLGLVTLAALGYVLKLTLEYAGGAKRLRAHYKQHQQLLEDRDRAIGSQPADWDAVSAYTRQLEELKKNAPPHPWWLFWVK